MNFAIEAHLRAHPWALQEQTLSILIHHGTGGPSSGRWQPQAARGGTARAAAPRNIAVIPMRGVITQRPGMFSEFFGGSNTQELGAAIAQAVADDSIGQILLEIDSPGGSVYGLTELHSTIMRARQIKPVVVAVNSLAASAAYWIASAADEVFVTPGGEVGSIGVWVAHEDVSAALKSAGVDVTLVSAGEHKTEGNPYGPLDPDAKRFMQSRVNDYYGSFIRDVARGCSVPVDQVRTGMGQGRVLGADAALAANMVDGVLTFDQVVQRMQRSSRLGRPASATSQQPLAPRHAAAMRERELQLLEAGAPPRASTALQQPRPPRPNLQRAINELKLL